VSGRPGRRSRPPWSTTSEASSCPVTNNRRRVLEAAERLFARHGGGRVTMEEIARAAGVGKGTLYRRYPDRAAIAVALLDEHERALQEQLLRGPPPLGPGAPPAERLAAFYAAMVRLLDGHLHLALGAETDRRRFATGAYGFWRAHVRALLAEGGRGQDEGRLDALVDLLLAPSPPSCTSTSASSGGGRWRRSPRPSPTWPGRCWPRPAERPHRSGSRASTSLPVLWPDSIRRWAPARATGRGVRRGAGR
jgi:AcrR family transcriptional regulator